MCAPCYKTWWWRRNRDRKAERQRRPCKLCGRKFSATDPRKTYCSPEHSKLAWELDRSRRRGEELIVVRDPRLAERLIAGYLRRGCRRLGHRHNGQSLEPYVSATRRESVTVIRARLPRQYREEAA